MKLYKPVVKLNLLTVLVRYHANKEQ